MQIHQGDSLKFMKTMADNSVDLILTDPPYFRVKKEEAWDNQWKGADCFIEWVGEICREFERILKPNGTLFFFASPQMRARVELEVGKYFKTLPTITWVKESGRHWACRKESLRSFFPQTEAIIFAEQKGADKRQHKANGEVFEPIRQYLVQEWEAAGLKQKDANIATGTQMANHWFGRSQWSLPSAANYAKLQAYARKHGQPVLKKKYGQLRGEYLELRKVLQKDHSSLKEELELLRRPFSVTKHVPFTDVWKYSPVQGYPGKHPCEKPAPMMEHMISACSRPGAIVFDPFMGSGSTGIAAQKLGRHFIGCDLDPHWCNYARKRIEAV